MRYGSVCSGIEAATVAWHSLGWTPSWFSEIEKFPSAVLAHRYPKVPNHGDMCNLSFFIEQGLIEAPDILVGGTPCQAFSIAGLRNSLDDGRGQLSLEFVRLLNAIDSKRSTRNEKPCVAVWENVPGVLNTKDNAFGYFLGALAGEECALQPSGKKWTNAGCVLGPQRQVYWRVLDAQHFGLAQRRKRVFVVASARTECLKEILFEPTSLCGDSSSSRKAEQKNSRTIAKCLTRRGAGGQNLDAETATFVIHGTQDPLVNEEIAHCLGRNRGQENAVLTVNKTAATLTRGFGDRGIDADQITNGNCAIQFKGVRRLTPIECERLQGFPDNYTNIPKALDSHRYAALGNSMAVNVMNWIGMRIAKVLGGVYA
ncbi:DNA cytosine methyltransferase [Acinetobacter pittii]|uniref:DNA cytosine methyltransferase n=1 Tax=Acinetobacter pittii TaxID=48296 RepID=UPI0032B3B2DD|nr:DNA cytosine methyltransferase [Acinetobacter baumannii]HCJ7465080.1 DNA cytosine methyltransferase [Acinetobacter baumannii]HCJ7822823.1 DNA cytosine methyltransferase [Acinetobacter baumannii]